VQFPKLANTGMNGSLPAGGRHRFQTLSNEESNRNRAANGPPTCHTYAPHVALGHAPHATRVVCFDIPSPHAHTLEIIAYHTVTSQRSSDTRRSLLWRRETRPRGESPRQPSSSCVALERACDICSEVERSGQPGRSRDMCLHTPSHNSINTACSLHCLATSRPALPLISCGHALTRHHLHPHLACRASDELVAEIMRYAPSVAATSPRESATNRA
jgi:hypothetical protein